MQIWNQFFFAKRITLWLLLMYTKFSSFCKIIFIFSCILPSVLWETFYEWPCTIYISLLSSCLQKHHRHRPHKYHEKCYEANTSEASWYPCMDLRSGSPPLFIKPLIILFVSKRSKGTIPYDDMGMDMLIGTSLHDLHRCNPTYSGGAAREWLLLSNLGFRGWYSVKRDASSYHRSQTWLPSANGATTKRSFRKTLSSNHLDSMCFLHSLESFVDQISGIHEWIQNSMKRFGVAN